jgi:Cation transport ATPase
VQQKSKFNISGMSCAACAATIEKSVGKLPGLSKAEVNLLANSMQTQYDATLLSPAQIEKAVKNAGFEAKLVSNNLSSASGGLYGGPIFVSAPVSAMPTNPVMEGNSNVRVNPAKDELRVMQRRLLASFLFLLPLMYLSMGTMLGLPLPSFFSGPQNSASFAFTQFLLSAPIILVNYKYFSNGFKALFRLAPIWIA